MITIEVSMAYWQATNAKAKFSGLLDAAESEGPQLIHRRKQTFVVTTEAEIERRLSEAREGKRKKFISAWDALRPSFDQRYDVEFPRVKWKPRSVRFE
jgi:prevent-host-death family protein